MLFFFFFNDTATTEIYTLPLHDALPILPAPRSLLQQPIHQSGHQSPIRLGARTAAEGPAVESPGRDHRAARDRKSTRLNSSHSQISYAVFCLKKKKQKNIYTPSSDPLQT